MILQADGEVGRVRRAAGETPHRVGHYALVLAHDEIARIDRRCDRPRPHAHTQWTWEAFASRAIDVLEVMREPTETMIEEGWEHSETIGGAYTAMIETAMIEGSFQKR